LKLKDIQKRDFLKYFESLIKLKNESNKQTWKTVLAYLREYFPQGLSFGEIDIPTLNGFREYLMNRQSLRSTKSKLSQNTASSYFNKLKESLKQAFKDGLLQVDINSRVEAIKTLETHKEFLTIEELQSLVSTHCNDDLLKRAALFCALTGLR